MQARNKCSKRKLTSLVLVTMKSVILNGNVIDICIFLIFHDGLLPSFRPASEDSIVYDAQYTFT